MIAQRTFSNGGLLSFTSVVPIPRLFLPAPTVFFFSLQFLLLSFVALRILWGFLVFGCIFVRSLLGCVIVFQFQYICIRCFLKSFISSQWRVNWRFYLGWHLTVLLLLLFLDKCTPLIEAQAKNTAYAEASLRNTTDYLKKSSRQNHQTS